MVRSKSCVLSDDSQIGFGNLRALVIAVAPAHRPKAGHLRLGIGQCGVAGDDRAPAVDQRADGGGELLKRRVDGGEPYSSDGIGLEIRAWSSAISASAPSIDSSTARTWVATS